MTILISVIMSYADVIGAPVTTKCSSMVSAKRYRHEGQYLPQHEQRPITLEAEDCPQGLLGGNRST